MRGVLSAAGLMLAVGVAVGQGDPARKVPGALRRPGTTVRVELVGDSTQTLNAGYGRGFCANFTAAVECVDMAKGGASTKTYRADGLWAEALGTRPDYMLIQFGHNDVASASHAARETTLPEYEANLRGFVMEARAAGITPVLVTPLARRYFGADGKIHDDLTAHADAMTAVGKELKVAVIPLHKESEELLDLVGPVQAEKLAITKKDADGKTIFDKTHLNWAGSYLFGRIVAKELGEEVPAVEPFVLPEAAKIPAEGEKALRVLHGAAVKIVLVGDSTVAAEGGWGPGFCGVMTANVTCVDLGANGRSSKSYLDEGLWAKALAEKGDYYLIQFGHNDQKTDPARHTDAETGFEDNLRRMVKDVRGIGGVPVLVTSLSRRTFKEGKVVEDLNDYAAATRNVGREEGITVIDLNAMSTKLLDGMTQAQADEFDAVGHADAKAENGTVAKLDRTHLNDKGKAVFGRIVADALVKTQVELGPDVKGLPAAK